MAEECRMCPVASEDGDFLLVDKPLDWTSFDVVAKVRNAYTRAGLKRKVGHSGTLDPKATGLLLLAAGRYTKKIAELELLDKGYEGCIKLGVQTVSHDTESEEFGHTTLTQVTAEAIMAQAEKLPGVHMQQPPMHSAVWHHGKRLYELARKGDHVAERKSREITIHRFEVTRIELPYVWFSTEVSKGAYIRVMAHEFGEALGVGGYLVELRRTSIGSYRVEDACSVGELVDSILIEGSKREKE
ncbi:tRNA pseudouridine(55) synthase TruB [Prosthecochloris sp. CIB 2401]|uniref:tRNA pseudouridine(55) synthase TruB n=1 Tax=Prosthecochloris sp. CIB 2401 TaxID=1868325 RepID=UPI00080AA391|nr:tRNA pseudouridine(55) synthase TruB [Prosthecochloris sp. CIB 2401]ANT64185.1 tRNA pseudouridine synthase B [Prosthecochloris sp. CIB 2401]